jgi:hypothetical protein
VRETICPSPTVEAATLTHPFFRFSFHAFFFLLFSFFIPRFKAAEGLRNHYLTFITSYARLAPNLSPFSPREESNELRDFQRISQSTAAASVARSPISLNARLSRFVFAFLALLPLRTLCHAAKMIRRFLCVATLSGPTYAHTSLMRPN